MHIVVKCEDMIFTRVLINNGSALNVCPTTTLKPSTMVIKAFDSTRREVQGKIKLMIEIDPRSFMVNFQVIKVDSPYNMFLGRP